MSFEYLTFSNKYQTFREVYDNEKNNLEIFLKKKIDDDGYRIYSIYFTFKKINRNYILMKYPYLYKIKNAELFRDISYTALNRFHTDLSKELDITIFKNRPDKVPILITIIDKPDKPKEYKKELHEHIELPHINGFLLIHPNKYHGNKLKEIISNNRISMLWSSIKYDNEYYCHDIDIRPLQSTLEKTVNYNEWFMTYPEYSDFLKDKESSYEIRCYDKNVKDIKYIYKDFDDILNSTKELESFEPTKKELERRKNRPKVIKRPETNQKYYIDKDKMKTIYYHN